ncbi:sulfurtransferase [Bosea caraganae]|uniref:Sulfurtransferase n=1 Tax=Bosea caraganae TaxID=2763117 RepID=A0A370LCM9_9HYPH|nr:sulfurtransferase [Bosea caraganae]RDJ27703.1 sulfurtransferase [Bosea caraganae]RDJ29716.1 sulfurtransferase [Bosea caraganae]
MSALSLLRRSLSTLAATLLLGGAALADSSPLVTTDWLEKNLSDPKVRIVEVSVEPGLYERGHIPGAQNVVWHTDLVDTVTRDIASPEKFQALARKLGIDKDTTVILYGDSNNWFAAWGAWVFDIYGLRDNVKLVDGGRKKWELEKRLVATNPVPVKASTFTVAEPNRKLRARLADVVSVVEKKSDARILDIRSPDEFSGKIIAPAGFQELALRAGHIPGSVNVAWARAVNQADGTIKPVEELRKLYAEVGIDGSKPVITTCRIGERSSHTWFILSRLLGYQVANYDGSWTEYGNTVGLPINNPAGTVWGGK